MKEKDIDQLIENFNNSEPSSFRKIYDIYYPKIFGYARSFVDLEDAEDITATAFIKLWEKRLELQTHDHVQGFLLLTTKNACINFLEREKYLRSAHKHLAILQATDVKHSYYLEFLRADLRERISAELEKLTPREKDICRLAYLEGLRNPEIAKVLGIEEQTVRNLKTLALKRLRVIFQKEPLFLLLLMLLRK